MVMNDGSEEEKKRKEWRMWGRYFGLDFFWRIQLIVLKIKYWVYLGGFEGIVGREMDVQEEDTTRVRGPRRAENCGNPLK